MVMASVACCPVCQGKGLVYSGFYDPHFHGIPYGNQGEPCRSCQGIGYLLLRHVSDTDVKPSVPAAHLDIATMLRDTLQPFIGQVISTELIAAMTQSLCEALAGIV